MIKGQAGRKALLSFLIIAALGVETLGLFVVWPLGEDFFQAGRTPFSLIIYDRRRIELREILSDENGSCRRLEGELPPHLVRPFLAAEDRRFFQHAGVDLLATARALWQNLRAKKVLSGASTISQQLVRHLKNLPRSWTGKLQAAAWALRLERSFDKTTILREYLNRVPLGNSVYGLQAAAQFYFGRPATSLSWAQSSLLAGLACSPASYDPYRHPRQAAERQKWVLHRLEELGWLEGERARQEESLSWDLVEAQRAFRVPHLTEWMRSERERLGLLRAHEVITTIDLRLQQQVERIVQEELSSLRGKNAHQAAVLVVDNPSGEVLAYVGSRDFLDEEHQGQIDGVRARRQPGSTLKPFAYGLGLADGYTPASLLPDVEVHLSTPTGDYMPRNYDRRVHGPVRLRSALANSYNIPAVRLTDELGPERVLGILRLAGFDSLTHDAGHYGVGVVLGNGEVSLWELARAYRGLALGGRREPLRLILEARGEKGERLRRVEEISGQRFLPVEAAELLSDILSDNQARAPAFGYHNALRLPFAAAVKTGTSRGFVDNWTVGYTKERTVAVWVGNFDGRAMRRVSGITGAGPIWRRVMLAAMEGINPRPLVEREKFERRHICAWSGKLATENCPAALEEIFLPGSAPREPCSMHLEGGRLDVGPQYYAWARAEGLEAGPWPESSGHTEGKGKLLMPGDGDHYLLEPDLPLESQSIPLRVLPPRGASQVEIRTSTGEKFVLGPPYVSRLAARRGRQYVELWLPGAESPLDRADFEVK